MDYSCKYFPIRQSTRLSLEIPLRVTPLSSADAVSEDCRTVIVNAHGCGLTSTRPFEQGASVQLQLIENGRTAIARVVDVVALDEGRGSWLVGLALEKPGNFWGIQYVPADWNTTSAPEQESVQHENGNNRDVRTAPSKAKNSPAPCHLAAISTGACYLQSEITFPRQTPVAVRIAVPQLETRFAGTVLVEHAQSGMGIEFAGRDNQHRDCIEKLIGELCKEENPYPQIQVQQRSGLSPGPDLRNSKSAPASADAPQQHDSLLALLLVGSRLTRSDFLRELERQRRSAR